VIFRTEFFRGSESWAESWRNCPACAQCRHSVYVLVCLQVGYASSPESRPDYFSFLLTIMSSPVELYVYDLSNGMARQLSAQLTGRQIDGIWHTSVVVFGKEVFYGQGINISFPGQTPHGTPMQVINMGETALDEDTFNDYLEEMKEHYTADKVSRTY